jgi:hypothetical protein
MLQKNSNHVSQLLYCNIHTYSICAAIPYSYKPVDDKCICSVKYPHD